MKIRILKRCFAHLILLGMCGILATTALPASSSAMMAPAPQDEKKEEVQDYDELVTEAQSLMQTESYEEAAAKWKMAIAQKANNPQHVANYAYSLHMSGQLDEAIKIHKQVTLFPQTQSLGLYNLGCAYSLKKEIDASVEHLTKSMDAGFDQFELFETDTDLDNVRKDPRFADLLARAKNGGRPVKKFVFAGKWVPEAGMRSGEKIPGDRLPPEIEITDKMITIPAGPEKFVMSYTIDKNAKPMTIDMKIEKGPGGADGNAKGIVKFEKGQLTLCYEPTGKERPDKFESSEEDGRFMFVMKPKVNKFDASKMVGNWQVINGVRMGNKVQQERLAAIIKISDKTVTIPVPGTEPFVMGYKVDHSKSPAHINMAIESGPAPPSEANGIVKYEDGKLFLCYHPMGGDRPSKFEATEENGCHFFELKLAKATEKKSEEKKKKEDHSSDDNDKEDEGDKKEGSDSDKSDG